MFLKTSCCSDWLCPEQSPFMFFKSCQRRVSLPHQKQFLTQSDVSWCAASITMSYATGFCFAPVSWWSVGKSFFDSFIITCISRNLKFEVAYNSFHHFMVLNNLKNSAVYYNHIFLELILLFSITLRIELPGELITNKLHKPTVVLHLQLIFLFICIFRYILRKDPGSNKKPLSWIPLLLSHFCNTCCAIA